MIDFNTFDDLLTYCKICTVCSKDCSIIFELSDLPNSWFDLHSSKINDNNVLQFCGTIIDNIVSQDSKNKFSTFELLVPIKSGEFNVESDFFPDSFEFFIEGKCNHCSSRYIVTDNLFVDKSGISNFCVELETIYTEKFNFELNYDDDLLEVYDIEGENKIADFNVSKLEFNFNNLKSLEDKISKYLMLS